ncbi:unnamed protein product [Victoria cruziana]
MAKRRRTEKTLRTNPISRIGDANGMRIEVGDLSTAPVSPDYDYIQGSTLSKIEYHRVHFQVMNLTPEGSTTICE